MRVLFANIPFIKRDSAGQIYTGPNAGSRWPWTTKGYTSYACFPFLMGYATNYLRHHDVDANFYDGVAFGHWDYERVKAEIARYRPKILFLETSTPLYHRIREFGRWGKQELGARIVLIGPHMQTYAEEILQSEPWVDHCVIGEYEKPALEIVRLQDEAQRLYRFEHLDDINEIDGDNFVPYRPFGYLARYWDPSMRTRRVQLQVNSSRGCPFKCTYCQWPKVMNNGVYRSRRPELVLDEIRMVIADYNAALRPNPLARAAGILGRGLGKSYHNVRKSLRGKQTLKQAALRTVEEALYGDKRLAIRSLFFDDDTWNLGASRIRTLCAGLEKIGLPWTMMGRTDVSSPALYDRMVESGCVGMRFGVESFNQRLLDNVKKNMNGKKNYDMVECLITRYSDMEFHFTTMKNLPGETEADWREDLHKLNTLKEIGARRNNVIHWQNSDCVAFPGTELWEEMVSRGRGDQLRNFELFDASVQNTEKLASEVRWLGENYEARWSDYSGMGEPTMLPEDTPIDEPVHPPGSAPRSD